MLHDYLSEYVIVFMYIKNNLYRAILNILRLV